MHTAIITLQKCSVPRGFPSDEKSQSKQSPPTQHPRTDSHCARPRLTQNWINFGLVASHCCSPLTLGVEKYLKLTLLRVCLCKCCAFLWLFPSILFWVGGGEDNDDDEFWGNHKMNCSVSQRELITESGDAAGWSQLMLPSQHTWGSALTMINN